MGDVMKKTKKVRRLPEFQIAVLLFIHDSDGPTGKDAANHFKVESKTYGRQQATATAISELRSKGLVVDCPRCPECGKAQSRGIRNKPLYLTLAGRQFVATLRGVAA